MNTLYVSKIGLEEEAEKGIFEYYERFKDDEEFLSLNNSIEKREVFADIYEKISKFSEKHGLNRHTTALALFALSLDILYKRFMDMGATEVMFYELIRDLSFKARECFDKNGVYGIDCGAMWYQRIFECDIYAFGRLQYQKRAFSREDYTKGPYTLKTGDLTYSIHIPSDGKLLIEDVMKSLERAYNYFSNDGSVVFFASETWLLYPDYLYEVFAEGTNTFKFAKLFDIVHTSIKNFSDFRRVFPTGDINDVDALEETTSLQRRFKKYLKEGKPHGVAHGIIVYDKNGIVK